MQGLRFYADYGSAKAKRSGGDAPNALALLLGKDHRCHDGSQEAMVATFGCADSGVSLGSVVSDYLRKNCKRIPETEARRIHPALFARLDVEC